MCMTTYESDGPPCALPFAAHRRLAVQGWHWTQSGHSLPGSYPPQVQAVVAVEVVSLADIHTAGFRAWLSNVGNASLLLSRCRSHHHFCKVQYLLSKMVLLNLLIVKYL